MIPVLYPPNTTDFSSFGLGVLTDTISCEVTEERNGVFECLLKYPVSGQHISYDLANVPVMSFSTESRSPQLILSQLLAGDTASRAGRTTRMQRHSLSPSRKVSAPASFNSFNACKTKRRGRLYFFAAGKDSKLFFTRPFFQSVKNHSFFLFISNCACAIFFRLKLISQFLRQFVHVNGDCRCVFVYDVFFFF